MKKIFYLLLALSMAILVGCGKEEEKVEGTGENVKAEAPAEKPLIGLAIPETHLERWVGDAKEMKAELEKRGYRVEIAYADADQTKQNQQVEGFLTNGAKGIIIGSINEAAAQAAESAKSEGVPVIAYDRLILGTDSFDYYVTFDNYKVGALQGQGIVDGLKLDEEGDGTPKKVLLFAGSPTDNNARYFYDGAMDILNKYVENGKLEVVGPYPKNSNDPIWSKITIENWQADKAKTRMENLLASDARDVTLDAILAPNDTLARAIVEALSSDGKYDDNLPVVTGQDAELLSAKWIEEGKQTMTVFKDTRNLAKSAAEMMDQILKGESVEPSVAHTVDKETYNVDNPNLTTYLLKPVAVSKENLDKELIESGFYTKDQVTNGK